MKLLAVISHKGGAGKTTSAVMLAEELAERGYRVMLVDADRQHSAGLLLDLANSEERIQETRVSNLDYFASGRLTELDVEERYAELQGTYDVGVVDTPSLDDALARAWLRESDAALVVLQVEPLTMKTMHAAMATIETVRRVNPRIQVLGLLPTMFDESQATHRTLLTELTSRRRDSVFPAIPQDSGLMHRAGMAWAAQVGAAARDAYWSVADRVVSTMDLTVGPAPREVPLPVQQPAPAHERWSPALPAAPERHAPERHAPERHALERHAPQPEPVTIVTRSARPGGWGRTFAPFALGFAAALLVLALLMGTLRSRLFGTAAPAYAVPAPQAPTAQPAANAAPKPAPAATTGEKKAATAEKKAATAEKKAAAAAKTPAASPAAAKGEDAQ